MSNDQERNESMCTEWTNEKHSLYLKSIEASFVNQLYDSMGFVQNNLSLGKLSRQTHLNSHSPSGQFKVLHSGCWKKINFERTKPQPLEESEISTDILSNPWIRHFRTASKKKDLDCSFPEYDVNISEAIDSDGKKSSSISNDRSNLCHQSLLDNKAEVSDQNFIDEDIEEGKAKGQHDAKRLKTFLSDSSDYTDQVVPLQLYRPKKDVLKNSSSSVR